MSTFELNMVSTNGVFYEGPCHCMILPVKDGEMAIMAHHQEMLVGIVAGELRFQTEEEGEWRSVVVGQGGCQVANNRVVLISDTIERPEDIDAVRARQALERAEERLRQKQSMQEYHMTRAAMARALARIKETEKYVR